jgi:hypothetical protein
VSYDVHLQRFEQGEAARVDSPLVWKLLEEAWDLPPDQWGYCHLRRGGDDGDLYGARQGRPIDALMFNHAGPAIYEFMYSIAVAGDMAILSMDAGPFIVREDQRNNLPPELRQEAVVVESGEALLRAITEA